MNKLGLSCAKLSISWSWPSFALALYLVWNWLFGPNRSGCNCKQPNIVPGQKLHGKMLHGQMLHGQILHKQMLHGQMVLDHLSTFKDGFTNFKCPWYFAWLGGGVLTLCGPHSLWSLYFVFLTHCGPYPLWSVPFVLTNMGSKSTIPAVGWSGGWVAG